MRDLHSIWLMPAPEDEALFQEIIDELAMGFGAPRFQPHLTLIGDLARSAIELTPLATEIGGGIGAFTAPVRDIGGSPLYFRSFYALFEAAGPIGILRRRAIAGIAPDRPDDFMPHISLLYGVSDGPEKRAAQARTAKRLLGRQIRFDRICVVASAKEIPIAQWAIRFSVSLGSLPASHGHRS